MSSLEPKVRHKSFTYATHVTWSGGRAGVISSGGKQSFRVSSPPEFKGESGNWTPEDLYVASLEVCQMTTFLAMADRYEIPVISYQSQAQGILEFVDGGFKFTKVTITPTIVVTGPFDQEVIRKAVDDAHKHCLVANSVCARIEVEPVIFLE